ncbi:lasso peptide biosynthesis B2 protein [uncultured Bradyrhizobium sp.]|uniref:lasso peptide biosynthesis B2 protein n=1 Tax=uncultured Bradyrhizobium sp. TaxID=199684 RepID=UPI0035C99424
MKQSEILYPAPLVRHVEVELRTILLDIRDGRYVVMNETASVMWRALVTLNSEAERLEMLSAELRGSKSRLQADTRAFTSDCLKRGYLQEEPVVALPPVHARNRFSAPTIPHAWMSLVRTRIRIGHDNFRRAYEYALMLPKPAAFAERGANDLAQAQRAFVSAENLIPLVKAPIDCLPRSLALYHFLMRAGIDAHHFIGVQRFPFRAHAWVESGGQLLLNDPDEVGGYTTIATI